MSIAKVKKNTRTFRCFSYFSFLEIAFVKVPQIELLDIHCIVVGEPINFSVPVLGEDQIAFVFLLNGSKKEHARGLSK